MPIWVKKNIFNKLTKTIFRLCISNCEMFIWAHIKIRFYEITFALPINLCYNQYRTLAT